MIKSWGNVKCNPISIGQQAQQNKYLTLTIPHAFNVKAVYCLIYRIVLSNSRICKGNTKANKYEEDTAF